MRLSDAIRLGAMVRPQAFGDLFKDDGSCAMGAAYEAAGILTPTKERSGKINTVRLRHLTREAFPLLPSQVRCPDCRCSDEVATVITHLNDDHLWTRERIADWVETVEPAEQPALEPATATNAVREVIDSPVVPLRA